MILVVVDQVNEFVGMFDAIHRHAHCTALRSIGGIRLRHNDMVDRLPIPVVQLERFPICGQARHEMQCVHFPIPVQRLSET